LHLSEYLVKKGDSVKQGDPIAKIGNSTSNENKGMQPHLHVVVFNDKTMKQGLKITSWDGNSNFCTGSIITSSNGSSGIQPPPAPEKPVLSQPANNSILPQSKEISLIWNSSANAAQYKVELWGGPYTTMTPCDWQGGTSCRIGVMLPGTFYWHVKARSSSGQESDWSATWSFTIEGPTETPLPLPTVTPTSQPLVIAPPVLREPANGANYSQSKDVWFSWKYSAGANEYYLEYWGGPYGTLNSGWINDVAYHIGTMWPGKYHWRVKARSLDGRESNWSDVWTFTISESVVPSPVRVPTNTPIPPTPIPPSPIPPTVTPIPKAGYVELVDPLSLRTEAGNWPPQSGQKLIAHIKIRNGGDLPIHIEQIGVRGRRNGSEFWDIGFWTIDLNGHDVWSLDPNNERPLAPGNYSFRISYSLDGSTWTEIGNEINFTVP
jgi:hypothetical protein